MMVVIVVVYLTIIKSTDQSMYHMLVTHCSMSGGLMASMARAVSGARTSSFRHASVPSCVLSTASLSCQTVSALHNS